MSSKTIILTGGTRGIGLAIVNFLLETPEKHNLVVLGQNENALRDIQSRAPGRIKTLAGDLSKLSLAQEAVDLALSVYGRIDGLVINHGTLDKIQRISECDLNDFRHTLDVNFLSAVAMVKTAIPHLRKSKGRIVFTSSGAAVGSYAGWGAYGSSKAAMNHLAMTVGTEEPDIASVAIRPGVVDTDMQTSIREEFAGLMDAKDTAKFANLKKDGQLLRPEQPGNVIAKLALNAPPELSGQFLNWNDKSLKEFQQ